MERICGSSYHRAFVRDIRTFVAEDNAELAALMQNIQEVMSDSDNK
jgi:hypothetical protein